MNAYRIERRFGANDRPSGWKFVCIKGHSHITRKAAERCEKGAPK